MAQITSYQHSYSNAQAYLHVSATAKRTGAGKVEITANWRIETHASFDQSDSPDRYLVLFVGSATGKQYFLPMGITAWKQYMTYTGQCVFTDVALASDATSVTIGFGVSWYESSFPTIVEGNPYPLLWNGTSPNSNLPYKPDIQFGTLTGITQWYTACAAPTSVVLAPSVYKDSFTITWSGAKGGTNNPITGYALQLRRSADGVTWSGWVDSGITTSGQSASPGNVPWGGLVQYRVRTKGSAGEAYYSAWANGNVVRKVKPIAYIVDGAERSAHAACIHNGAEFKRYLPYKHDGTEWKPCLEQTKN